MLLPTPPSKKLDIKHERRPAAFICCNYSRKLPCGRFARNNSLVKDELIDVSIHFQLLCAGAGSVLADLLPV